ncbi:MAG TPA: HlyD family secretion protein [Amaricoccus sp.]|uniref:HlyD family secretion protein n=1 Tax=Amaricoccus sp. TaxID=1872485 RepID=UPI002C43182A|nr:HlyD family secretion protein [Amaricoccus sp.]HRO12939.1 HlyD family secretion protein [Amaricoccus sp.]
MTAQPNSGPSPEDVTPLRPEPPAGARPEPAPAPRPRGRRRLLIVALPLALALAGGYVWVTGGRYVATEDAYVKQDRVSVMPQVSGQIDAVLVGENAAVRAGDTLFAIDPAVYRSVVDEDRAKLESARLEVEKLKAAYAQAVSEAATAREALATAETQDARQQALFRGGVVPQAAADDSALKLQQAKGALAQAESRVLSARAALAGDPDIATDRHPAVLEALAALNGAELDLANTTVRAPVDGVVSQTARLQHGQYVTPAVPVVTLVATDETWIEANFKETDLTHMLEGQPVEVTLDTFPDRPLKGEIDSIGAGTGSEFALLPAQNASGNWVKVVQRVPLRVELEPGQALPALRTGMSASVEVDTGHVRGLPRPVAHALAALGLGGHTAVAAPAR